MPKDTFFNLPEEKRAAICEVAVDEFAAHSFAQASINRIVANAGIAKGSFYQYFEDKSDLFLYLVQMVADEKLKYLAPVLRNPGQHDFFTLLRELSRGGIQFAVENPKYAEIGKRLMSSQAMPLRQEVTGQVMPSGLSFFETLLQAAVARGEIRADINCTMLAYMLTQMYSSIVEYYLDYVSSEYDETLMQTLDQFLDFLRQGIGTKNGTEPSK